MKPRLSIFDLDHTLLNTNSCFRFGVYLYRRRFFQFKQLLQCLSYYARHRWFGMSIENLHRKSFETIFKGKSRELIQQYATSFLNEHLQEMTNESVLILLRKALQNGEECAIFSGSTDFLVGPIAKKWGVKRWEATIYQTDLKGDFSRITRVMEGDEKVKALHHLMRQLGSSLAVTVYTDSVLDLPLLEAAEKPIGVFPDKDLRKICLVNGWQILE